MQAHAHIVFYDGECGLCQRSVAFILKWDRFKLLSFAPLNGVTYKTLFTEPSDMSTVVFYRAGQLFTKSEAIIEIGRVLGGWAKLLLLLRLIPRIIRDSIYYFVASKRNKVSCIILIKDERFLN